MVAEMTLSETRTVLHNVSWETYERLNNEVVENSGTRFAYNQGDLEIMVVSFEHEELNRYFHDLFSLIAMEFGLEFVNAGSTTFKKEDLARGFEPDTCFYIRNADAVRGKKRIDLDVDPPPDLVIEIDITHPSLNKFPIFSSLGISEVWRYDGDRLTVFRLSGDEYVETEESSALPGVSRTKLSEFLEASKTQKRTAWMKNVRQWARDEFVGRP